LVIIALGYTAVYIQLVMNRFRELECGLISENNFEKKKDETVESKSLLKNSLKMCLLHVMLYCTWRGER
jgi:hypothetical protein